ncbi:hypothetical protein [Microbulbifer sp. JMSA008]|uniref:hypothetical protein n=1 Tax=Microbulbifer sp. JMSA008 TaxID=3243373 RepID=UPI004039A694
MIVENFTNFMIFPYQSLWIWHHSDALGAKYYQCLSEPQLSKKVSITDHRGAVDKLLGNIGLPLGRESAANLIRAKLLLISFIFLGRKQNSGEEAIDVC